MELPDSPTTEDYRKYGAYQLEQKGYDLNIQTYLTDKIAYYIGTVGCEFQPSETPNTLNRIEYVNKNFKINWNEIEKLFADCEDIFSDAFEIWFEEKLPVFHQMCHESVKVINNKRFEILLNEKCKWTNRREDVMNCYKIFCTDKSKYLEVLLMLTSIYEKSLGDLHSIKNKDVPFLLKDLLWSEELCTLLGSGPMKLLQMLMGTPRGFNFRNLAWHGYLTMDEIQENHLGIFFILLLNINDVLLSKRISYISIPRRPLTEGLNKYLIQMQSVRFRYLIDNEELDKIFESSVLIADTNRYNWKLILQYARANDFMNAGILLLPMFENVLRTIYCLVNGLPTSALEATMDDCSIDLEMIIEDPVKESDNKMTTFKASVIDCCQDLFIHADGPRISDILSRGDIILDESFEPFINIIFNIITAIMFQVHTSFDDPLVGQLGCVNKILKYFTFYKSTWHPNVILQKKILNVYTKFEDQLISLLNDVSFEYEEPDQTHFDTILAACGEVLDLETEDIEACLKNQIESLDVPLITRGKSKLGGIIQLMSKAIDAIMEAIHQITQHIEVQLGKYENRLLTSKEASHFQMKIPIALSLEMGLKECLYVITVLAHNQFVGDSTYLESSVKSPRLYWHLQYMCNYVLKVLRFTSEKNNEWEKAAALTKEYENKIMKFLDCQNFLNCSHLHTYKLHNPQISTDRDELLDLNNLMEFFIPHGGPMDAIRNLVYAVSVDFCADDHHSIALLLAE